MGGSQNTLILKFDSAKHFGFCFRCSYESSLIFLISFPNPEICKLSRKKVTSLKIYLSWLALGKYPLKNKYTSNSTLYPSRALTQIHNRKYTNTHPLRKKSLGRVLVGDGLWRICSTAAISLKQAEMARYR